VSGTCFFHLLAISQQVYYYKILSGDLKNVEDIRNNISLLKNKSTKTKERKYLLEILESLGNVLEESLT